MPQTAWLTWSSGAASFSFDDYAKHAGRKKGLPAFDAFDLSSAENSLFGNATTDTRHFTSFGLRHGGSQAAEIDGDLKPVIDLMNPMYLIGQGNADLAAHWWIRHGTSDSDTALPIITNLATSLENKGKDVNAALYWDAGHGADQDPEEFIAWIGRITGYAK